MDNKLRNTINKLLALTKSSNKHEAELAGKKAHKLLTKAYSASPRCLNRVQLTYQKNNVDINV